MSRISLQRWSIVSTRTLIKRWFVTPGDTVPINYIKDKQHPVIKKDEEYPPWVMQLSNKLPSKNELIKKLGDDAESMSRYELRRAKRLITLDDIKAANLLKVAE